MRMPSSTNTTAATGWSAATNQQHLLGEVLHARVVGEERARARAAASATRTPSDADRRAPRARACAGPRRAPAPGRRRRGTGRPCAWPAMASASSAEREQDATPGTRSGGRRRRRPRCERRRRSSGGARRAATPVRTTRWLPTTAVWRTPAARRPERRMLAPAPTGRRSPGTRQPAPICATTVPHADPASPGRGRRRTAPRGRG